jgi:hypothetical protein
MVKATRGIVGARDVLLCEKLTHPDRKLGGAR